MPLKTYRGTIAQGEEHVIRLSSMTGSNGYRITKFDVMPPSFVNAELIMRIWSTEGHSAAGNIDFADSTLLAAAMYSSSAAGEANPEDSVIIFDTDIVNQDIYVTNHGIGSTSTMNYFIELEEVTLNDNETFIVTLRDLKKRLPQHGP